VLVCGGIDVEFTAGFDQPGPTGAEPCEASLVELLLERVETAERGGDGLRDVADGRAALSGAHDLPEHGVVNVTASVVAYGGADILRHGGAVVRQQFLDGLVGQVGGGLQ